MEATPKYKITESMSSQQERDSSLYRVTGAMASIHLKVIHSLLKKIESVFIMNI